MTKDHVGKQLKIIHDGTVSVTKGFGVILGDKSLGDIIAKAFELDESVYAETFNALVTITIEPKPSEPLVGWHYADE